MTEQVIDKSVVEQPADDVIDYKAFYEANKENVEKLPGLVKKTQELLGETKAAKEEKRKAAEMVEQARKEQEQIAAKNGEFEKLYKQKDEEYSKLVSELEQTKQAQRTEKIDLAAMKVAAQLAKGDADKAELLSVFLAKTIGSVADEKGSIDAETLADIAKQFEQDKRYAPLLGGNLSSGGSAPGNTRGAQSTSNSVDRATFSKWNPDQQMKHIKSKGIVTD